MEPLVVGEAGRADLGEVLAILAEAARRLRGRGIEQWPDPFPAERVAPGLARGEVFLASRGGRAIATLTLQREDVPFWGEQPPVALYLHRLAVRPEAAGAGAELVEWAARRTAAAGRRFLRLDCLRDHPPIRRYYERLGFVHRGDVDVVGFAAALYERDTVRP